MIWSSANGLDFFHGYTARWSRKFRWIRQGNRWPPTVLPGRRSRNGDEGRLCKLSYRSTCYTRNSLLMLHLKATLLYAWSRIEANVCYSQRGGEGNVHKDKYGGHSGPQAGVGEKVKHAIEGDGQKKSWAGFGFAFCSFATCNKNLVGPSLQEEQKAYEGWVDWLQCMLLSFLIFKTFYDTDVNAERFWHVTVLYFCFYWLTCYSYN